MQPPEAFLAALLFVSEGTAASVAIPQRRTQSVFPHGVAGDTTRHYFADGRPLEQLAGHGIAPATAAGWGGMPHAATMITTTE
jgi:hypothetical protein